jgi:hypothetical protein
MHSHTRLLDIFSTKVDNIYGSNKCVVWTKYVFIFMLILLKGAQKTELNEWCKVLMTFLDAQIQSNSLESFLIRFHNYTYLNTHANSFSSTIFVHHTRSIFTFISLFKVGYNISSWLEHFYWSCTIHPYTLHICPNIFYHNTWKIIASIVFFCHFNLNICDVFQLVLFLFSLLSMFF